MLLASDFAPDPRILALVGIVLMVVLAASVGVTMLLARWTHARWVGWTWPLWLLSLTISAYFPAADGSIALLVIGGAFLAIIAGWLLARWPLVAMAVGAWAWAPGFPIVNQSVYRPFNQSLLPPIAAYTAAWALYAAFLVRSRRAYKRRAKGPAAGTSGGEGAPR
jgi:hypothetical protein